MPSSTALFSEATGTLTGAHDTIVFYHGLMEGGTQVAPDLVDLEFTQSQEAGGDGGANADARCPIGAVPTADDTITIGGAAFTEAWTWAASRSAPYQIAIGATAAASITNAVAAINADTIQAIVADAGIAGSLRVRSASHPGGTVEAGVRDWANNDETMGGAGNGPWATTSAGAGNVAGTPTWSVVARTSSFVRFRVRGMETTDSLTYRVRAFRLHSSSRVNSAQLSTGTNGSVVAGAFVLTSVGATFQTDGVGVNDLLVIAEPYASGVTNTRNNGVYLITAVTETTLTVASATPFKVTQGSLDFAVGFEVTTLDMEDGIAQVPFGLPGDTSHSAASPCTNVDVPGSAIETAEIADAAITSDKLAAAVAGEGIGGGAGTALFLQLSEVTGAVIDPATDSIVFLDATGSVTRLEAWADLAALIAGTGLTATAGVLSVSSTEMTDVTFDPAADSVLIHDATDAAAHRDLWSDIAALVAGDGIQAVAGVFGFDASDVAGAGLADDGAENLRLDTLTVPVGVVAVGADSFVIHDATDSLPKLESIADLVAAMAGVGLAASAGVLTLDFSELPGAVIDVAADSIPFMDANAANAGRMESVADLATAFAGAGLTAAAGVLAVGAGDGISVAANDVGIDFQPVEDQGRLAAGWIRWAANSNVGDTITVGGVVFTAVAAGAVAFEFNQGGGTAATITSFVAAINADSTVARAVEIGGDVAALFARTVAAGNVTLVESSAGVRTVVSAATMLGSTAAADRILTTGSYTVTAADVTALDPAVFNGEIAIAAVPSVNTPTLASFLVRTAAGVMRSPATIGARMLQQGANEWALIVDETAGAGVLVAGDILTFSIVSST